MAITPPWALHVGAAIGMTTTVAGDTSVTFTALDGQVVTFSEHSTNASFTGTDINLGGCTAGDRGKLSLSTRPATGPIVSALKNADHADRRQ